MSSIWGQNIKISIFGESHGKAIGVVIDGLPPGEFIDFDQINSQMSKRKPGRSALTTSRNESDKPEIVSGVLNGKTTGSPVCAIIKNEDFNPSDYKENEFILRPGHADFTSTVRYNGFADLSGGGHLSGRLTAPIVFAGTICKGILERSGVYIGAHLSQIGDISDEPFDQINVDRQILEKLSKKSFSVINEEAFLKMKQKILEIKNQGNSIGGTIECAVVGLPEGIGDPIFDNIESKISSIIFAVPGVKGLEFGSGFKCSSMLGSEHNDEFIIQDGKVKTKTNNHSGILGGISTGMPIIFKVAFKPTASISRPQKTVNLKEKTECEVSFGGRHDTCIAVRAVPVVESAGAIAILDLMIPNLNRKINHEV